MGNIPLITPGPKKFRVLVRVKDAGADDRSAETVFPPFTLLANSKEDALTLIDHWYYVTWYASGQPPKELVKKVQEEEDTQS